MNSSSWLNYFQQNRLARLEPDWTQPCSVPPALARTIGESLSHFQLGESGEGRFLFDQARLAYPDDADYREALDLFIQEEREHARLLERLILRFGQKLLRRHWTHSLFRLFRRALGARSEIQVLVIAELVGTAYYRLLRESVPDCLLVEVCELVLRDEANHVSFHRERFATDQRHWLPMEHALWALQFQTLFMLATAVVWLDHRKLLACLGNDKRRFFRKAKSECLHFLRELDGDRTRGTDPLPSAA
jgi:hypothetical protein